MNSNQVSVAKDDHSNGELLAVFHGDSKPSEEWVLDSSCTFHMCPNRDWFSTYEIVSKGTVLMGKEASSKVADVGIVRIKMLDEIVKNVRGCEACPNF